MTTSPNAMQSRRLAMRQRNKFFDVAVRQHLTQPVGKGYQPCFILTIKAGMKCTVDIKNACQKTLHFQRNHDFCVAGGITGDMARERVHIIHALDTPFSVSR